MNNRVAIYVRENTIDPSCELQIKEINKFLNPKGWQVVKVYEEQTTGTNTNRPQVRILSDAAEGKFDFIVSWKLDRLFRSLKDLINTIQTLNELGIDLASVKDNLDLSTCS